MVFYIVVLGKGLCVEVCTGTDVMFKVIYNTRDLSVST